MAAEGGVALGVPFIGPETGRWAIEGARPATINGAVSSGGGNGEGKQGVGEMKGRWRRFTFPWEGRGCCAGEARRLPKAHSAAVPIETAMTAG
jgi:hypothetical protein